MKTEYQYIRFVCTHREGIRSVWSCVNRRHGGTLGDVRYTSTWRQWCYYPGLPAIYSAGCLDDIAGFMRQLPKTAAAYERELGL